MENNRSSFEELVTKGFLRTELHSVRKGLKKELKKEFKKEFKNEFGTFRLEIEGKMDRGFKDMRDEMTKQTDIFQKLADKVIGVHKNFEIESSSIKYNYVNLEGRVKKLETRVFPT